MVTAAAAAAVTKFDSTSLTEAARESKGDRGGMRALGPAEKTVMAGAEKAGAGKTADGSEKGQRQRRNLSDVSVMSPRKGRTKQGKKAGLVEKSDGDSEVEEAPEIVKID